MRDALEKLRHTDAFNPCAGFRDFLEGWRLRHYVLSLLWGV